ncbi:cytidylyltransferase domain-containing protein [Wocania ichthyoenteri]|uniref:cytidylyltransferase domain-containing protein n=1 Tax=Wocania ichthyoenteri TaxID=1230531 RepID=UPI0006914194|nr:hypothetical protein [Wocania ichthyoenteri]
MNDLIVLIQARTGSSRLPGKVLLPFYKRKSILEILINQLRKTNIKCVVCTSTNYDDNRIIELADRLKVSWFRGSEHNVLERFVNAGNEFKAKGIIRICADNPFLNIGFLNEMIETWKTSESLDYLSYKNHRNIPVIKTHLGLFAEIISLGAMERTLKLTTAKTHLEHVTNFIYENDHIFKINLLDAPDIVFNEDEIRLTIDNNEDFINAQKVYTKFVFLNKDIHETIKYIKNSQDISLVMKLNIKKYNK